MPGRTARLASPPHNEELFATDGSRAHWTGLRAPNETGPAS